MSGKRIATAADATGGNMTSEVGQTPMNVYCVKYYEIGVVITKEGEGEVYEAFSDHDSATEQEAIRETKQWYDADDWNLVRIRFIKKELERL